MYTSRGLTLSPSEVGEVTFDLTPTKARARILDKHDKPKTQEPGKKPAVKEQSKKPRAKNKKLPTSQGDADAYWITKNRRGAAGKLAETTLGYEVGFFSTQSQGLTTGVVVREASQANKTEFTNWVDQYELDWKLVPVHNSSRERKSPMATAARRASDCLMDVLIVDHRAV